MAETAAAIARAPRKLAPREALGVACGAHALHDGLTDLLYVLLPIWQAGFGLDYAAVGLLRALTAGTMAGLQVPSGWLGRRLGGGAVLAAGTALVGLAYMAAGVSGGLVSLAVALALGGVGLSTQHPIASALVARNFPGGRSRIALGTYNFSGDIGKMAVPAATAWLITFLGWRPAIAVIGALALAAAAAIALRLRAPEAGAAAEIAEPAPRVEPAPAAAGAATAVMTRGFCTLLAIGVIDSATRMGFLTFLPFLLHGKGADLPTVGFALTLVFAGGAAGKFVCGFLGERLGVFNAVYATEGLTAAGILALLPLSLAASLLLLPVIGIALNGTSSVLYGTVPELAPPGRREHAFGIFYTGTVGGGALSPVLYGLFANVVGIGTMMVIIAGVVLSVLPLARLLRREFAARPSGGP
ncbi:MAG TPA: MFS transporter [Stellaceae bacterium]|nr:MFS transporter [Stellaceae bacterium]